MTITQYRYNLPPVVVHNCFVVVHTGSDVVVRIVVDKDASLVDFVVDFDFAGNLLDGNH